jgi:solute carrier family 20 (sodium-dependent phosphate transporter)
VGSRALTLKQACCIAAVFEFTGAVALGAAVSSTVQGGIASSSVFKNDPDIFMYGMLCALTSAAFWLLAATYFSLPVSTTHSISKCGPA